MNDSMLIKFARQGVKDAFRLLLERYATLVYLFCLLKIGDSPLIARAITDKIFNELLAVWTFSPPKDLVSYFSFSASYLCSEYSQGRLPIEIYSYPQVNYNYKCWQTLHALRQLPDNYQLPLLFDITQKSNFLPQDQQILLARAHKMLRQKLGNQELVVAEVTYEKNYISAFMRQAQIFSGSEHFYEFYRNFVAQLAIALALLYLVVTVHYKIHNVHLVFLAVALIVLFSVPCLKGVVAARRVYNEKRWEIISKR